MNCKKKLKKKKYHTSQLKYGIKLMMPIAANLVSVESRAVSVSPSSVTGVGRTSELNMQVPIAIRNGVSFDNSALHIPLQTFLFCK